MKAEEESRFLGEIWKKHREATSLMEGWIEDRIKGLLGTLPHPAQKELKRLQKRIKLLRQKVQRLSEAVKENA